MYQISKEFHFSSSHQLNGLAPEHPCSKIHGHNYIVIVEMASLFLDQVGMIIDYRELALIKKYIDEELDHRHLNDVFDFNPTAENMAKFLYEKILNDIMPGLRHYDVVVKVKETPKTEAVYYE